eukprot:3540757-Rhodomonas_salina.4
MGGVRSTECAKLAASAVLSTEARGVNRRWTSRRSCLCTTADRPPPTALPLVCLPYGMSDSILWHVR